MLLPFRERIACGFSGFPGFHPGLSCCTLSGCATGPGYGPLSGQCLPASLAIFNLQSSIRNVFVCSCLRVRSFFLPHFQPTIGISAAQGRAGSKASLLFWRRGDLAALFPAPTRNHPKPISARMDSPQSSSLPFFQSSSPHPSNPPLASRPGSAYYPPMQHTQVIRRRNRP
jgi:hypothetical protein